jgi:hypothetical protein
MANRILRDWTQSENINKLSDKAEVFFTRLIMKADDYGCYYGNLKLIKSALYPLRDISESDIYQFLQECEKNNLILMYVVDNKDYIKIFNFGQRLRLMKSKFPQPNDSTSRSNDSNPPLETKRNEVETEVETKRNEKESKLFDEDLQLPYIILEYTETILILNMVVCQSLQLKNI